VKVEENKGKAEAAEAEDSDREDGEMDSEDGEIAEDGELESEDGEAPEDGEMDSDNSEDGEVKSDEEDGEIDSDAEDGAVESDAEDGEVDSDAEDGEIDSDDGEIKSANPAAEQAQTSTVPSTIDTASSKKPASPSTDGGDGAGTRADVSATPEHTKAALLAMKKAELTALVKQTGISVKPGLTKEKLAAALVKHYAAPAQIAPEVDSAVAVAVAANTSVIVATAPSSTADPPALPSDANNDVVPASSASISASVPTPLYTEDALQRLKKPELVALLKTTGVACKPSVAKGKIAEALTQHYFQEAAAVVATAVSEPRADLVNNLQDNVELETQTGALDPPCSAGATCGGATEPRYVEADLECMKKARLVALVKETGLDCSPKLTKAKLVSALVRHFRVEATTAPPSQQLDGDVEMSTNDTAVVGSDVGVDAEAKEGAGKDVGTNPRNAENGAVDSKDGELEDHAEVAHVNVETKTSAESEGAVHAASPEAGRLDGEDGEVKDDEDGESKADENGEVNDTEDREAKDDGEVKADEDGGVKDDEDGEVKDDGDGEVKDDGDGEVEDDEDGEVKAEEDGEIKADEDGEIKADEDGEVNDAEDPVATSQEDASAIAAAEALQKHYEAVMASMPPMPEGWMWGVDPNYGHPYYYNSTTNESSWVHPAQEAADVTGGAEIKSEASATAVKSEKAVDESTQVKEGDTVREGAANSEDGELKDEDEGSEKTDLPSHPMGVNLGMLVGKKQVAKALGLASSNTVRKRKRKRGRGGRGRGKGKGTGSQAAGTGGRGAGKGSSNKSPMPASVTALHPAGSSAAASVASILATGVSKLEELQRKNASAVKEENLDIDDDSSDGEILEDDVGAGVGGVSVSPAAVVGAGTSVGVSVDVAAVGLSVDGSLPVAHSYWSISDFKLTPEQALQSGYPFSLEEGASLPKGWLETMPAVVPLEEGLSATGGMRQGEGDSEMTPAVDSERSNTSTSTVGEDGNDRSLILAMDCEMVTTTSGSEVARISIVDRVGKVVYDQLVLPSNKVVDYNTKYSGITEDQLRSVTLTFDEAQQQVRALVTQDAYLVGHSLESDLQVLKLVHRNIVDTSILFPHPKGWPFKQGLASLVAEFLGKKIQTGDDGHDSVQDAWTAMELVILRLRSRQKGLGIPRNPARYAGSESLMRTISLQRVVTEKRARAIAQGLKREAAYAGESGSELDTNEEVLCCLDDIDLLGRCKLAQLVIDSSSVERHGLLCEQVPRFLPSPLPTAVVDEGPPPKSSPGKYPSSAADPTVKGVEKAPSNAMARDVEGTTLDPSKTEAENQTGTSAKESTASVATSSGAVTDPKSAKNNTTGNALKAAASARKEDLTTLKARTVEQLSALKVSELKEALKLHSLETKGRKAELVQRLHEQEMLQQRELETTMELMETAAPTPAKQQEVANFSTAEQEPKNVPVDQQGGSAVETSTGTVAETAVTATVGTDQDVDVEMSVNELPLAVDTASTVTCGEIDLQACNTGGTGDEDGRNEAISSGYESADDVGKDVVPCPSPWWDYNTGSHLKAPLKLMQRSMDVEGVFNWDSKAVSQKRMGVACKKAYRRQTMLPPKPSRKTKVPVDSYDFSQCKTDSEVIDHFRDNCFIQMKEPLELKREGDNGPEKAAAEVAKESNGGDETGLHLSHNFVWLRLQGAMSEGRPESSASVSEPKEAGMTPEESTIRQLDRLISILKKRESPDNPVLLTILTQNGETGAVKRLVGKK
jgi:DNA polymerase III epsilon subunit-like protein